jgi:hypothetical protein
MILDDSGWFQYVLQWTEYGQRDPKGAIEGLLGCEKDIKEAEMVGWGGIPVYPGSWIAVIRT